MFRLIKTVSAAACAFLAISELAAQQPAQAPPGLKPQTGQQAGQTYRGPIRQNPWFSNKEIRQQLKLNDDQYNRLNKSYGEAYTRYEQSLNNLAPSLTPEQKAKQQQELQQNFYRDFSTVTNDVITDQETRNRLNQLNLQYRGYDAFRDPTVQEKLNLSEEQRTKLMQYNDEYTKAMNDLNRDYTTDQTGVDKRFNELRKNEVGRMEQILNENQRQTWRQLTGDPYNFQSSIYFQSTTPTNPTTTPKR